LGPGELVAAKPTSAGDELRQLLQAEVVRLGTKRSVAKALGLTEGRLGRVLRGEFSLSVLSCLRFSKTSGAPPGQILRAAEKGEVADLIEELYAVNENTASPGELELLRRYRRVGAKGQSLVREVISTFAPEKESATSTSRRKRA
jgi:transcriptional regulator with XRE-family HTH domain